MASGRSPNSPAVPWSACTNRSRTDAVALSGNGPVFDLRSCLDQIYDDGRYGDKIDYSKPAIPPLNQPDSEWAASLFAKPAKKKKK